MGAKQDLNGPAMRIVFENRLIRQGGIGTKEYPKGTFLAHRTSRIGEQNHCVVNFVERPLVAINHVRPAFHRYRVKTAGVERGGQVRGRGTFSSREKDTVGFHRTDQMAPLLQTGVKNTGVGVSAVHQDIGTRLIRKRADDVQSHIDFRAVFRAIAFQGIT